MHRIFVPFLFCITPVIAEPALILTEANVAARIHADNPDLKAARWKIQEALGQWQQAGRPARPQLNVQWNHDSRLREGEVRVGVVRSFPVTDRLAWEKEIGKAQVEAAEMEVKQVEQELITEARLTLMQVAAIKSRKQCIALEQKDAEEFAQRLQANQVRAEASALDAAQAKIDAATLQIEQRQLDAREVVLLAELKKLLGMPLAAVITVPAELPALQPVTERSATRRADYQQALRGIDAARCQVQREMANRYDDLDAGIFLGGMSEQDAPEGLRREVMLGFQFNIPLPFGNDNSGNIATAKASVERKEQEARAILANARQEASGATAEMLEWKKLDAQISSELLPLAEQQLKLAEQSYAQGQGDLATIFRSRAQKRQLMLSRIDARSSYHLARIRREAACGGGF